MKCLLYQSSSFNHLWRNGFLSFNKLLLCYLFLFIFTCEPLRHSENLPQEFAVPICRGHFLFVFVIKSFFVYVSKSCLYERKPFLYVSKSFLFVRFTLLTVFLFVIAVAVMGHRTCELVFHCICWLKFCNFCMK